MNVGNQEHLQWIQRCRPTSRRERSLGQGEAFFQKPIVWIPYRREMRIKKPRYDPVRVAFEQLEKSFVWIDPSPFFSGHCAWRGKFSCVETNSRGSERYGGRNDLAQLGVARF